VGQIVSVGWWDMAESWNGRKNLGSETAYKRRTGGYAQDLGRGGGRRPQRSEEYGAFSLVTIRKAALDTIGNESWYMTQGWENKKRSDAY